MMDETRHTSSGPEEKTIDSPDDESKVEPCTPIVFKGGKQGEQEELNKRQLIAKKVVQVGSLLTRIKIPERKVGKKERRIFFIIVALYVCIFAVTSITSMIGGEEVLASPHQKNAIHADPVDIIGFGKGEPSVLLDCSTSTETTTDENGDSTSTSVPNKYIAGGSPKPDCDNGKWSCPDDDEADTDYVPIGIVNGENNYVICLSAGSLTNYLFYPDSVQVPELNNCDPNAYYEDDGIEEVFIKEDADDPDPAPTCVDVAGIMGKVWLCPPGYQVDFSAWGVLEIDFYEPLECNKENEDWIFPCSDIEKGLPNVTLIQTDWLSGNHPAAQSVAGATPGAGVGGRFLFTFPEDTYKLQGVKDLMPYTLGIGMLFIVPSIVLIGFQVLYGSITFRYANALQMIPRLVLGVGILAVAFAVIEVLITFSNSVTEGIVLLHKALPYPQAKINGENIAYTLTNESDSVSYRGMVVPMSRWGCAANKFMEILARKFIADVLGAILPIFGNLAKLAITIANFFEFIKNLGQFMLLILSIMAWAQVLVRIILLNYYILLCPIAFGCWALPGGYGQGVVNQWTKGFLSTLAIQIVQVFILTTMPLLIPVLPEIPADSLGLMKGVLTQLPPVIVMWMVVRSPAILGTSTARAVTQAGSVAGGVVTAVGAAAYNVV